MKTIEELAKEAAKHIRTEHGLQLSDFIATEFLRVAFALRDAEAVPAWWHYEINGNWDGFSREMPDDDACDEGTIVALYEHAPIPSDLQAENERLKADRDAWKLTAEQHKENYDIINGDLRMKLAESQAECKKLRELLSTSLSHAARYPASDKFSIDASQFLYAPSDDTALREYVDQQLVVMKAYYEQVMQDGGKRIADLKAELAALKQQEPVAWFCPKSGFTTISERAMRQWEVDGYKMNPLYTAPATDYKPIAERLLGALVQIKSAGGNPEQVWRISKETIAAARAAGLGEAA